MSKKHIKEGSLNQTKKKSSIEGKTGSAANYKKAYKNKTEKNNKPIEWREVHYSKSMSPSLNNEFLFKEPTSRRNMVSRGIQTNQSASERQLQEIFESDNTLRKNSACASLVSISKVSCNNEINSKNMNEVLTSSKRKRCDSSVSPTSSPMSRNFSLVSYGGVDYSQEIWYKKVEHIQNSTLTKQTKNGINGNIKEKIQNLLDACETKEIIDYPRNNSHGWLDIPQCCNN